MVEQELLVKLVRTLESSNIPYMLTGSYVSSLQGQPRSTHDKSRFGRRKVVRFLNFEICVSSPEDTILAKLLWAKQSGGSHKQLLDAIAVYELQGEFLDKGYLVEWVKSLELEVYWEELTDMAEPLE